MEILPELAKYGIGGIFAGVILYLWQKDTKRFEQHLIDDAKKETGLKEQAEKDRDRMIDVAVTSTTAIQDLRHSIELENVRKEKSS